MSATDWTRVTVNFRPRGMAALEALAVSEHGKTAAVERSVIAYLYLTERIAAGAVLKLHHPGGAVEAVTFL